MALPILVLVVVGAAVLSLNTFPVLTNDTLLYLDYSRSLGSYGFVTGGYRQFGYPLFLAVVRGGAGVIGVEPLLAAAIIQRALLLAACALAWIHWRWWSLGFIALLVISETLVYANLLLTEGLALPLAALMVFPTIFCLNALRDGSHRERSGIVLMWSVVVASMALALFSLRFTFVVFGAVPLGLLVAAWGTPLRRKMAAVFAGFVLCGAGLTVAMSVENQRDWGVFTPSAYGATARYYYAWMQVFRVNPENQANPALAEFYDDGQLREFLNSVLEDDAPHEEKWAMYDRRTNEMLEAAGMSIMGSRFSSMAWSLAGGRIDDVGSALVQIIPARRADIEEAMYFNSYYDQNGAIAFATRYNEGRQAEAVITDPVGRQLPSPGSRWLIAILLPISLIVMVAGLWRPPTRLLAATGLTVVVAQAIGMGWIRTDNLRFLLPGSVFGVAAGTAVLCHLLSSRRRPSPQPAVTV